MSGRDQLLKKYGEEYKRQLREAKGRHVVVSISLTERELALLDEVADECLMKRSEAARYLIRMGYIYVKYVLPAQDEELEKELESRIKEEIEKAKRNELVLD